MLIERVAQVTVRSDAMSQSVVQIDAEVAEARVPEETIARAETGFFVQSAAAEVAGEVRGDASARKSRHKTSRMFGAPGKLLADREWRRGLAGSIERKNAGFEQCV